MGTPDTPGRDRAGAGVDDVPTRDVASSGAGGLAARLEGDTVGPYTLRGVLGEGGMGVVFEAQQERPIRRRVALKVIKPGMDSEAVLSRFEVERQALAVMDHPNIARVIDGGATARGLPYFVMDLVRGVPITDFCDRHTLGIPERLELFMSVCRAVQHAHSKGVIHRDLKPSNILVAYTAGAATAKVIDFGVAKAVGGRIGDRSVHTLQGQLVGTPEYMSPEQAEMSGLDIDTRTDVYALGVVLYELVAGVTPLDAETVRSVPSTELHRLIRECETPRPSTKLGQSGGSAERAARIATARRLTPEGLSLELRRDLDWIVLRCLEKDRERRYQTPAAIEEDLRRYLAHEPVQAGPPELGYRARKFVRRHRAAAIGGACVLGALLLGGAATVAGMVWALREERRATAESERAREAEAAAQASLATAEEARGAEGRARLDAEHERGRAQLALARSLVGANEFAEAAELLGQIRGAVPEHEWWWTAWACARGARVTALVPAAEERSEAAGGGPRSFSRDGSQVGVFGDGATSAAPERVFRFADGSAAAPAEWKDVSRAPVRMRRDRQPPIELASPDGSFSVVLSKAGQYLTALDLVRADGSREPGPRIEHGDHEPLVWIDWERLSVSNTRGYGTIEVRTWLDGGTWSVEEVRGLEQPAQALWHDAASLRVRVLYDDGSLAEFGLVGSGPTDVSEIERWLLPSDASNPAGDRSTDQAVTTRKLVFSPDGSTLFAGSYAGWVTAFDARTHAMLWKRNVHPEDTPREYQFGALAVAPDGRRLLASGIGSSIAVLNARSGEPIETFATSAEIGQAAFVGDGRIAFSMKEGTAALTAATGEAPVAFASFGEKATVYDIAASPDGARIGVSLATGVRTTPTDADGGELAVFENASPARRLWSRALPRSARAVRFSPDGKLVACSDRGGTATLWDAATGEPRGEFRVFGHRGHEGVMSGIAFHPTAPVLATATHDSVVRLWSTTSGLLLAEIPLGEMAESQYFAGRLKDVRFQPSGDALAIAFEERVLWIDLRKFDGVVGAMGAGGADRP